MIPRLSPLLATLLLACGPSTPAPETCEPSGTPVLHQGTIAADETWPPGVHEITSSLTIGPGATLTLSACTVVRMAPDANLLLSGEGAALVAPGTEEGPIWFVRSNAAAAWGRILVQAPATVSLAWTLLSGGGGTETDLPQADYFGASLVARGSAPALPAILSVDEVYVGDSTGVGVFMLAAKFAPGSNGLIVTGAGSFPVYAGADTVTDLPPGDYTGNAVDEILLQQIGPASYQNARPLIADATLPFRGVPYRVGTSPSPILVGDSRPESPAALLTIEPGVTLRFHPQSTGSSQLRVSAAYRDGRYQAQGALRAVGTAALPIRFTSASTTPTPGDWGGLYFHNVVDPRTEIAHAVIEYAGADSQTSGVCFASPGASNYDADCSLILFLQSGEVPSAFVQNTRFANGLGCGVYRGWRGAEVDFTATNQFEGIAGCRQSGVAPEAGTCPECSL